MATQVEQRASNGGINNVSLDIDDDTLISRAERRPLTLSRCRNLYQAPEFVQRLTGDDSVLEGSTVRFECRVKGFPKPTMKWYKDEEILELDDRISVESLEQGTYALVIADVTKKDEATYRCRIENNEGSSSSTIYLSVKGKSGSRSPKRRKSSSPNRRIVSYPSLFPTIEEKIVEEEKEEEEVKNQQPSPLSKLYESNKLRSRHTWPKFVGDWAFATDEEDSDAKDNEAAVNPSSHRSTHCGTNDDDDVFTEHIAAEITQTTSHQPRTFVSNSSEFDSTKESSDLEKSRTSKSIQSSVPLHPRMDDHPPVSGASNTSLFLTEPNTNERTTPHSNDNNTFRISSNSNVVNSSNGTGGNNNNNNNNNNSGNISRINRASDNEPLPECHSNGDNFGRDHRPLITVEAARILRTVDTENSTTMEGVVNRGEMAKDQPDRDQYVSIEEGQTIGGGMLTSLVLLTSFTFCALCIKISPGIFMVSIFMATFMFQVIRQLNTM